MCVGVARITKPLWQTARSGRLGCIVGHWSHNEHIVSFYRLPCLIFRHEDLVYLLPGSHSDIPHVTTGCSRCHKIEHSHARNLGNKYLPAVHLIQAAEHKMDG